MWGATNLNQMLGALSPDVAGKVEPIREVGKTDQKARVPATPSPLSRRGTAERDVEQ